MLYNVTLLQLEVWYEKENEKKFRLNTVEYINFNWTLLKIISVFFFFFFFFFTFVGNMYPPKWVTGMCGPEASARSPFQHFSFSRPYFIPKSKMSRNFKLQILKISKEFSYKDWKFGKIKFTWLHSVEKLQFTRVPNSAVVRSQAPLLQNKQNKQTNKTTHTHTHTKWKLSVPVLRVIRLLQLNVCWNSVKRMKEYPFCIAKKYTCKLEVFVACDSG